MARGNPIRTLNTSLSNPTILLPKFWLKPFSLLSISEFLIHHWWSRAIVSLSPFKKHSTSVTWHKNVTPLQLLKKFMKLVFCYQNCSDLLWEKIVSSDWEKLLKFEAEGREFSNFLRSLEQFFSHSRSEQFW